MTVGRTVHHRTKRTFEYRVIWKHKTQKSENRKIFQIPHHALRFVLRLLTDEPWRGMTEGKLRKSWIRYALHTQKPWSEVSKLKLREVAKLCRDIHGPVQYLRVEFRQVGDWVVFIDPLHEMLQAPAAQRAALKMDHIVEAVDAMDPDMLDRWRVLPRDPHAEGPVARQTRLQRRERKISAQGAR